MKSFYVKYLDANKETKIFWCLAKDREEAIKHCEGQHPGAAVLEVSEE